MEGWESSIAFVLVVIVAAAVVFLVSQSGGNHQPAAACGEGKCDSTEDCNSCPTDCGICSISVNPSEASAQTEDLQLLGERFFGLCKNNSVISGLGEYNSTSVKELVREMPSNICLDLNVYVDGTSLFYHVDNFVRDSDRTACSRYIDTDKLPAIVYTQSRLWELKEDHLLNTSEDLMYGGKTYRLELLLFQA